MINKDLTGIKSTTLIPRPQASLIPNPKAAMLSGQEFNRNLVEAPLNKSISKASFAFSKAKRFSNVSVDEHGFAISVLKGTESRSRQFNMTSATTTAGKGIAAGMGHLDPYQHPRSIKPLNM